MPHRWGNTDEAYDGPCESCAVTSTLLFVLLPTFSASSDLSSASPPPSLALGDLELDFPPTPSSAVKILVKIVIQSSPQSSKSRSSLPFPILPVPPDASITAPAPRHSTSLQRPPRLGYRHPPLVYGFSSTFAHCLPLALLTLSRFGLARFNFAFVFITPAVPVSTRFNASVILCHYGPFPSTLSDAGKRKSKTHSGCIAYTPPGP
ncbi:hypothetical protein EDB84DRAFT_1566422 [Lactarius hengduanensis]|nr:hypothetical protein EDB84DRAFT_1566422 [Lactarius hengduanensis]